jgi:ATP-binding cassette subfamily C (CFTR/MRP) protein 1
MSIFFCCHCRIETVMHCDKILVLGFGRLLEFGSPADLLADPNSHFAKIAGSHASAETNAE